jgi:hypothetical protein
MSYLIELWVRSPQKKPISRFNQALGTQMAKKGNGQKGEEKRDGTGKGPLRIKGTPEDLQSVRRVRD